MKLLFLEKIKKAVREPRRLKARIRDYIYLFLERFIWKKRKWVDNHNGIKLKAYNTYFEYVSHQKSKLSRLDLYYYDNKYREVLQERLKNSGIVKSGLSVLCLAARIGTEVKSFFDLDCFAVGTDLNPGKNNKFVLYGDFHDIQFPDNTVDIVFTNSFDHSIFPERLIQESKRVLRTGGYFILEIGKGARGGIRPGYYEAAQWENTDDCLGLFKKAGFAVFRRFDFDYPWNGEQVVMQITDK